MDASLTDGISGEVQAIAGERVAALLKAYIHSAGRITPTISNLLRRLERSFPKINILGQ